MATSAPSVRLTELMLMVFRINGRLLEQGDRLVAPLGINSARWQVLGAVAMAGRPLSAPQIAEAMGITRQGAQKQLNRMIEEGLVEQRPNPRHLRSPLYALTARGADLYAQAIARNDIWAGSLAEAFSTAELEATLKTLQAFHSRLAAPLPDTGEQA